MSDDTTVPIGLPGREPIGYMRPWVLDPAVWDSWIATERGADTLVMNGSGRAWAEYSVLRVWQWKRLNDFHELAGRARRAEERAELRSLIEEIQECGTRMGDLIASHATEVEAGLGD